MPSVNRWNTFGPQLEKQGLGALQNNILPRVQDRSLRVDEDAADDSTWHAHVNRKTKSVLATNQDIDEHARLLSHALVASGPMEVLSATLQKLDVSGGSLKELIDYQSFDGCVKRCLVNYWEIVNHWEGAELLFHASWLTSLLFSIARLAYHGPCL